MAEVNVEKKQSREAREIERQNRINQPYQSLWANPANLFAMNPFAMMRRFTGEFDRPFSNWLDPSDTSTWSPAIEMQRQDGKLIVQADLPGLTKDDVKVEVTGEGLVIEGERKSGHEHRTERGYRSERSYGKFFRLIPLPDDAQPEQARAKFENGVLQIAIPVAEEKRRSRQIPIETAGGEKKPAAGEAPHGEKKPEARAV